MYSFVFLWTMALSPNKEAIQHGLVFTNLMAACMLGSLLSAALMKRAKPERYLPLVFAAAAAAFAVPAIADFLRVPDASLHGKGITFSGVVQMLAFCAFEVCVGVFWPSVMRQRAEYVPEEQRATIINVFRVPLNAFVCGALYNVERFPLWGMFALCAGLMCAAMACQLRLAALVAASRDGSGGGGGGGGGGVGGGHHAKGSPAPAAFERLPTSEGDAVEMMAK